MSYCRTSETGSDIYCFSSGEGHFEVLVANGRIRPLTLWEKIRSKLPQTKGMRRRTDIAYWLEPLLPTGFPLDGESYCLPTELECAEVLLSLRDVGYGVPQDAIDRLLEEADEKAESAR